MAISLPPWSICLRPTITLKRPRRRPKSISLPLKTASRNSRRSTQNLRDQVIEQNASLKRVEDQLEMVREATDRNTLEQQELLEDLKTFSNKVKVVAVLADRSAGDQSPGQPRPPLSH